MSTALQSKTDQWRCDFERLETEIREPAFTGELRRKAFDRFADLGFPTLRDEEWKYTNVARIAKTPFKLAGRDGAALSREQLRHMILGATPCHRLVFVNGHYAPQLSDVEALPAGVVLLSLAAALDEQSPAFQDQLGRYAGFEDQPFTALNTAFMQDGAYIAVPDGCVLEAPIHLVFASTAAREHQVSHPRNLIVVGAAAQATIVETYAGIDGGSYFTNNVTELVAHDGAVVDHYRVIQESNEAYHVGQLRLQQYRSSDVHSHTVTLGGALVRNDIHAVLDAEGCECSLEGLYVAGGHQLVDNHLRVEHAKPHCNSREVFKGILDGKAHGVFSGRIVVHPDAQKTDAKQTNMNLLLSQDAHVDTKPQLEIFADDVKCTHGATIGQIDHEAIFYLQSRGLNDAAARGLLIYAFANEIVSRMRLVPLREQLERLLPGLHQS